MTEEGVVIRLASGMAFVKTIKSSACESCTAKDSCNTMGGGKEMEVEAINTAGANIGDRVTLGFETAPLLKISFLLYVFPILCLIAGAALGQHFAPNYELDPVAISVGSAFLFFFIAFLFIKVVGKRLEGDTKYRAKVIRISGRSGK